MQRNSTPQVPGEERFWGAGHGRSTAPHVTPLHSACEEERRRSGELSFTLPAHHLQVTPELEQQ